MRAPAFILIAFTLAGTTLAAVRTKTIEYKVGDQTHEGFLAWDDAKPAAKNPGVIVIHEWWGNDDYSRARARQLAELGYVGFAIDMFGKGKSTSDAKQAEAWATAVKKDPDKAEALLKAGLDTLKAQPQVDALRIAAIGYCFGGGMVLNMARWGMDVDGVVSFHGDLSNAAPHKNVKKITQKILVCHGAADSFVPQEQLEEFLREMAKAGADVQVEVYQGAQHSFTNPGVDKHGLQGAKYNEAADRKSWEDMKTFLRRVFNE
jgi:dienelactone hydrolase